jgi:hypothetical protein
LGAIKGGPVVALLDEKEKPRVGLVVTKDGPGVDLKDEKGRVIWKAP